MDTGRIREMEALLDECGAATESLSAELTRMEALRGKMIRLFSYYGSDQWFEDREGDLPEGLKAGVLSEDAVYDEISEVRDLAFRMLELAADILKNRI